MLPNYFWEVSINLILRLRRQQQKENFRHISLMNTETKISNKTLANTKKAIHRDPMSFTTGRQRCSDTHM